MVKFIEFIREGNWLYLKEKLFLTSEPNYRIMNDECRAPEAHSHRVVQKIFKMGGNHFRKRSRSLIM